MCKARGLCARQEGVKERRKAASSTAAWGEGNAHATAQKERKKSRTMSCKQASKQATLRAGTSEDTIFIERVFQALARADEAGQGQTRQGGKDQGNSCGHRVVVAKSGV